MRGTRDWLLTDDDKEKLRQVFDEAMRKQLEDKGHFPIVMPVSTSDRAR